MLSQKDVKTTVIIPVYNNSAILRRCLEALLNSHFYDFDIIVVDDCSTDNSLQIAQGFGCQVIKLDKHSGPAVARNKGASMARGQLLIFLDSDVVCNQETIGKLIKPLEEGWDACIGIYSPVAGCKNFFSMYKNIFIWHYHNASRGKVDWFWAACGAIKKDVFNNIGGFSDYFRLNSVEDIDLGYQLTKKNYKIFLNKEAVVKHYHHFGLWTVLRNDFRKARDWTVVNFTRNRSLSLKHPVTQFKYRGFSILGSLLFVLTIILSIITIHFFWMAVFIFFILPFIEKKFFSSLLRYGGTKVLLCAWIFKPFDDLVVSIGVFNGFFTSCGKKVMK